MPFLRRRVLVQGSFSGKILAPRIVPAILCAMVNPLCYHILENIARDLSGEEVTFPTFLDLTFRIRTALKNPDLAIEQLASLVGAEPLMSVRIMRMANSAALNSSGRPIADVKTAVTRVGIKAVRTISFAVAMEQLLRSKKMAPFESLSHRLWDHTVLVAALSRVLARRLSPVNADEAMFAGLVHDIGAFYLLSHAVNFPELVADHAEVIALLQQWHDNIGHALLSALGQPEEVLQAVLEHEQPRNLSTVRTLADVVYLANRLADTRCSWSGDGGHGQLDGEVLSGVIEGDALAMLLAEAEQEIQSLKTGLGS